MSVLPPLLSFEGSGSVYLWTTYLTSVWLWFYALSGLLVRVVVSFRSGAVIIRDHLNIEEKPLSTMGFVAGGLMACGWWGICLMSWLRE